MNTITVNSYLASAIIFLSRLSLGLYLALAGYAKLFNMGVSNFYQQGFLKLKPAWLPELIAMPYGYAIPWLEFGVGLLLAVGLFGRTAAAITGLMILSFTIALVQFHGTLKPGQEPFTPNLIYVCMAGMLFLTGPGKFSVDALAGFSRKSSAK